MKSYDSIKAGWKNPNYDAETGTTKKKEYKDIHPKDYDFGVDENRINSFLQKADNYYSNAKKEIENTNYNNASAQYKNMQTSWSGLNDEANTIRAYYNANKANIPSDSYKQMMSYLENLDKTSKSTLKYFGDSEKFFSQFEDENQYNYWNKTANKYRNEDLSTHEAIAKLKEKTTDEEEREWLDGKDLELYSDSELANLEQEALNEFDEETAAKYHTASTFRKEQRLKNCTFNVNGKQLSGAELLDMVSERENELNQINIMATDQVSRNSPEYQKLLERQKEASAKVEEMKQIFAENGLEYPNSKTVLETLQKYADKGANIVNYGWAATLDFVLGRPLAATFGLNDNIFSKTAKLYKGKLDYDSLLAQEYAKKSGTSEIVGELVSGTVAALPDAIMGILSGGTSTAATNLAKTGRAAATNYAISQGLQSKGIFSKIANTVSPVLEKAGLTVQGMAQNPFYWTSFVRELGSDYEEAVENGAGDAAATFGSLITAFINAGIEIGTDGMSGIQGLPEELLNGNKSVIASWVESMIDEGKEEVLQGIVQNLVAKATYDYDKPLIGSEEAVVSPTRALEEFGMGAAVGGILGGGQILGTAALNSGFKALGNSAYKKDGQTLKSSFGEKVSADLVEYAKAHPEMKNTANVLKGINGNNVTDADIGKLYYSISEDVSSLVSKAGNNEAKVKIVNDLLSKTNGSQALNQAISFGSLYSEMKTQTKEYKKTQTKNEVRDVLMEDDYSDVSVSAIRQSGTTMEEFENLTGKEIRGKTRAEQEAVIKEFYEERDIARLPYNEVANITVKSPETGEDITIRGIKKKSKGNVVFETSAGEKTYGDLSMSTAMEKALRYTTESFDIDTANTFLRYMPADMVKVSDYANAFNIFYNQGYTTDVSFETLAETMPTVVKNFGKNAMLAAFNRGRIEARNETVKPNVEIKKNTNGSVTDLTNGEFELTEAAESLAKKLGIDITIAKGEDTPVNGNFVKSMLSMAINADGSNPFAAMIHETAEYAEAFNATGMKKVQDALIQWQLSKNGGGLTLRDYVKSYQDSYQEKVGEKLSYGEALKEITNDALGGLFSTDSGVNKFTLWVKRDSNLSVNEQVSVFRKIADILNAIAEKIRNFIKGTRTSGAETMLTTEERTILEGEEEFAKKLMNMFLDEVDVAIENRNSATVNENAAETVEYSINVNAEAEIKKALANKNYDNEIQLTDNTPPIMLGHKGVKNLPLVIKATHMRENILTEAEAKAKGLKTGKNIHYHGLGEPLFVDVIKTLDNVKEAYRGTKNASETSRRENYFLLVSEKKIGNDKVNIPVYINQKGNVNNVFMDMNKVATVFEREKFQDYITKQVRNGELVRIKRRNTQSSEKTPQMDAPYRKNVSSNKAIIYEDNKIVNPFSEKNSKSGKVFSVEVNVEETKDLVAVHNLSQEQLLKTLELGGFPMPSIAIIKAKNGHNEFGDVSVVFNKDTIAPEVLRDNKVYGGDAWTPSFPTIEYKPKESVENKISDKYYELARKIGYDNARPLYNYVNDMERMLSNGETEMLNRLYENTDMMNLYRQDIGENKIEAVKETVETRMSDAVIEQSQYILEKIPGIINELEAKIAQNPIGSAKRIVEDNFETIQNTFKELYKEKYGFTDTEIENAIKQNTIMDYVVALRDAVKYKGNNIVSVRESVDTEATKKKIKAETNQKAYREWIDGLFKGIEEKKGIRNNKDAFTYSGNRRSFEALHYEANLENIVKAMKEQESVGNSFFAVSGIWGAAAKEYNSIAEIKKDESRLKHLSEEEYKTIKEGFAERFSEIANSIMDNRIDNYFTAYDNAAEIIVDAVKNSKTKSGMLRTLQQYNSKATETTVNDIVDLVNDISNMPTEYFEAKPRRAVGLDEIKAVLIPSNASKELKTALSDYNTVEYESGNTDDRIAKLNSLEDVQFSVKVDKPKKSSYNEFETNAMQWANATQKKDGDTRLVYNPKSDEWCLIVSGREYDGGYGVLEYYSDYEKIPNKIRKGLDYEYGTDERNYSGNNSIIEENGNIEKGRRGNIDSVLYAGENAEAQRVVGNEPERGGTGDIQRGRVDSNGQDVTHSVRVDNLNSRKSLLAQEEKYEKAIKKLKDKVETLRGETKLTRNKKVDRKAVMALITEQVQAYKSKVDVDGLTTRLETIFNNVLKNKDTDIEYYKSEIETIVREIMDGSREYGKLEDYAISALKTIKTEPIYFSDVEKAEAAYISGSYQQYRNRLMGRVTFTNNSNALDAAAWAENLLTKHPELKMMFPDGSSSSTDVVDVLPDIIDMLKSSYVSEVQGLDFESNIDLTTLEFMERFADGFPRRVTFADKKEAEKRQAIKDLKEDLKAKYKEKLETIKSQNKDKTKEKLQKQAAFYKDKAKETARKTQEAAGRKEVLSKIYQNVSKFTDMLNRPTNNAHVPEVLKDTVSGVLNQITLLEKGRDYSNLTARDKTLYTEIEKMNTRLAEIQNSQVGKENQGEVEYSDFQLDLPPEFISEVKQVAENIQAYIQKDAQFNLNTMSNEDLNSLNYVLTVLRHTISQVNKMYANERYATIREVGNKTINEMSSYGKQNKVNGSIKTFLKWSQATPVFAFKRFGEAGETIFDGIATGWGKFANNIAEVEEYAKKTWTPKEVESWQKETHTIKLHDGAEVTMNVPQIMSLYLLNQREQGRKHIYGGGIKFNEGGKDGNSIKKSNLSIDDIVKITSKLSKRQLEVARNIQRYMSTAGSSWGNEISMTRFGYKYFTEPNYFPIATDENSRNVLESDAAKSQDIFRLLNMGATKPTNEKANAAVHINDVFDVFSSHMADMAKYNALALPILDTIKWLNYKEKLPYASGAFDQKSVRGTMDTVYGKDAQRYVIQFLKDLNGVREGGSDIDNILNSFISNAKVAKVAANVRVAALQPTSYYRATATGLLSDKALGMGLAGATRKGSAAYNEALQHSGLAKWKDLGYFDTNIARPLRERIKNNSTKADVIKEKSMVLAELGDKATWTALWEACRWETLHNNKDIKMDTPEFFNKVTKLFDRVILETQVMDSTITRSQAMRGSSAMAKIRTAFMSEQTLSYNILMNGLDEYNRLRGSGAARKALLNQLKKIGRSVFSYTIVNIVSALVETAFDWERDEDKDEKLLETFWENFVLNESITQKIPIFNILSSWGYKEFFDMGYASTSDTGIEAIDDLIKVYDTVGKVVDGIKTGSWDITLYGISYTVGNLLGDLIGLPISPALREAVSAYNTAVTLAGKNEWVIRKGVQSTSDKVKGVVNKGMDYFSKNIGEIIEYKRNEIYLKKLEQGYSVENAKRAATEDEAKKSIRSTLTSLFKDEYVLASAERRREIEAFMRQSGVYEDVSKTCKGWIEKAEAVEKLKG